MHYFASHRPNPSLLRLSAASLLTLASLAIPTISVADTQPPTVPAGLIATPLSSSSVELRWQSSTDNKRVRSYRVYVDGDHYADTRALDTIVLNLEPETEYDFSVSAWDGKNDSGTTSIVALTLAGESTDTTCQPSKRRGKKTEPDICDEPPVEEPPPEEPPPEEPPPEEPPSEEPVSVGVPAGWSLVFNENFDGSGAIDTTSVERNWRFENMDDALHRAGNSYMDEFGNTDVQSWQSANGKRWSAWYNDFHDVLAYRADGNLVMQGLSSGEIDPTRPVDYLDDNVSTRYGSSKLYTAWLDTFSRIWDQNQLKHVADPASPQKTFKYGYFEMRVNFSEMITPGFRTSFWLMPASSDAEGQNVLVSNAYDADGNNGVEIDIFEYEYADESLKNKLVLALQGGSAGKTGKVFDAATAGISLHEGYHTIGLLWEPDRLVWNLNGVVMKEIIDANLIPDVYSYIIVSREMNSGVKRTGVDGVNAGDVLEELPYRPRDPGLFAQNIWEFKDKLMTDRVLIDYVQVWQP